MISSKSKIIKSLESTVVDKIKTINALEAEATERTKTIHELKRANKKLRGELREQNEADILLNALKAVGIIKPAPSVDLGRYQSEQIRSMAARGAATSSGGLANTTGLFGI